MDGAVVVGAAVLGAVRGYGAVQKFGGLGGWLGIPGPAILAGAVVGQRPLVGRCGRREGGAGMRLSLHQGRELGAQEIRQRSGSDG